MKQLSIQVGLPRQVAWQRRTVSTGIFKKPVEGPVMLRTLNLDGDRQADLSVHGGTHKAVYVHPSEHYGPWRAELPGVELPWGAFGENFTTEGLLEDRVHIGDRFRIGEAEVIVTQPRTPLLQAGDQVRRPGNRPPGSWRAAVPASTSPCCERAGSRREIPSSCSAKTPTA